MLIDKKNIDRKGIISAVISYATLVGSATLSLISHNVHMTEILNGSVNFILKVWESYQESPLIITDQDMKRCNIYAKKAWKTVLEEYDLGWMSKQNRNEIQKRLINNTIPDLFTWDSYECLKKYYSSKNPGQIVQEEVLSILTKYNNEVGVFGIREHEIEKMYAIARNLTETYYKKLCELIENDHELYTRLGIGEMVKKMDVIIQRLTDIEKLGNGITGNYNQSKMADIIVTEMRGKSFRSDKSINPSNNIPTTIMSFRKVRKLTDGIYVNWETGYLGKELRAVLLDVGEAESENSKKVKERSQNVGLKVLTCEELRVLSILVQGEGAVISLEELDMRRRVLKSISEKKMFGKNAYLYQTRQKEVDFTHEVADASLEQGKEEKRANSFESLKEATYIRYIKDAYEDERERSRLSSAEIELYCKKIQGINRNTPTDKKTIKAMVGTLRKSLRTISDGNADIIVESEKGFRFASVAKKYDSNWEDLCNEYCPYIMKNDWDTLRNSKEVNEEFIQAWLRRHYNKICRSFENDISNARGNVEGKYVFGDYSMAQLYTNAYAKELGTDSIEPMLDYVEKWFNGETEYDMQMDNIQKQVAIKKKHVEISDRCTRKTDKKFGRVLVLHGQPGDGKTTFCKKAVYAYCREGWLVKASQVLYLSLNPTDSDREIISKEKYELDLDKAFCLKRNPASKGETYYISPSDLNEALIIFDGYDELAGDLMLDTSANSFWKFCNKVKKLASSSEDYKWNAIITSRTMCIEDELRDFDNVDRDGITIASFAPLTDNQQNAMVDRMIQLNREKYGKEDIEEEDTAHGDVGTKEISEGEKEERKWSLDDYKVKVLPELRKNKIFNDLLKIPSLFRMIVTRKFDDINGLRSVAELYKHLVDKLLTYRDYDVKKKKKLIEEYEAIAGKIFLDDDDTCTYRMVKNCTSEDVCAYRSDNELKDKELTYAFLTKDDGKETGRLGFLHGSFRQYFLACFIISAIQKIVCNGDKEGEALFATLSARRVRDPFIWQLVTQVAELEQEEKNLSKEHIKSVLDWLNKTDDFKRILKKRVLSDHSDAEKNIAVATEHAIFNLMGCVAAAEKGYLRGYLSSKGEGGIDKTYNLKEPYNDEKSKRIEYGGTNGYSNICRLLRMGNYTGIYLEGLNLNNCDLRGVKFENAVLTDARLSGSDMMLDGACLAGANLVRTDFEGASMRGVQFSNAPHAGVNIQMASLYLKKANLRRANLDKAHLEWANLSGVDLREAHLELSYLDGAHLVGANLEKTVMKDASLTEINLTNAYMKGGHFEGSNMRFACLEEAYLGEVHLEGTHLENARLAGAYLDHAHLNHSFLDRADLRGAWLHGAVLTGATMKGANLKDAYYTADQYEYIKKGRVLGINLASSKWHMGVALSEEEKKDIPNKKGSCKSSIFMEKKHINNMMLDDREITFGRYPKEAEDEKNGKKRDIHWRVLRREFDKVLLITENIVDCHVYHDDYNGVTWEACSLRKWLNDEFLLTAFNEEERSRIAVMCNQNLNNPNWGTEGGNATWDRVFVLSAEEADTYFKNDEDRMASPTQYAIERGSWISDECKTNDGHKTAWWWLRTPGHESSCAVDVGGNGGIHVHGYGVDYNAVSVRPVLWLNL